MLNVFPTGYNTWISEKEKTGKTERKFSERPQQERTRKIFSKLTMNLQQTSLEQWYTTVDFFIKLFLKAILENIIPVWQKTELYEKKRHWRSNKDNWA